MDGPVITAINKAGNLILASFLWLLCCIPVVTIGPSTIALYYVVVKCIRFDSGYVSKDFFSAFRRVWKKGILFTLFLLIVFISVIVDREYFARAQTLNSTLLVIMYDAVFVIFVAFAAYLFPLMTRFDLRLRKLFQLAMVCVFKYLPYTLGILGIFVGLVLVTIRFPAVALVIFPGLGCFLASYLLEPVIRRYMPEASTEEEKNVWYYQ